MEKLKYFGTKQSDVFISNKIQILKKEIVKLNFYLIIAITNTAKNKGISAVCMDSDSGIITPLADAEFLLFGPKQDYRYKLPLLKAGVTPALISYVCAKLIDADVVVVPIGIQKSPYFSHLNIEAENSIPSECVSTGKAMKRFRVANLFDKGFKIGRSSQNPIFISESVPGGTTTAQAVMEAIGYEVSHLTGSSLLNSPRKLKREIIDKGISKANLNTNSDPFDIISALGDPFQAFSMGLLIGARKKGKMVILSGGSQMIALLALALELISSAEKKLFADNVFVFTTNWLVRDNRLNSLLNLVSSRHDVDLFGIGSCLDFNSSKYQELLDFERGYVNEGVGAGGFSILAHLRGHEYKEIVSSCEYNLERMIDMSQII